MKWSWKLGEVAGIGVFVHATFFILIAWIGVSYWLASHSLVAVVAGIGFILALFGCVILHELGHALTARRFGIRTRDITLLPIGGVARLERMPEDPKQELLVALAGPAVNVVIGGVLLAWLWVTDGLVPVSSLSLTTGPFAERLMLLNVFMVVFNLIPAFPMDGGRVLRALLAIRMEYSRATRIAATLGQSIALLFGLVGLFINPFLVFIALFVWIGAAQEAAAVQLKSALAGILVREAMLTDYHTVSPGDPLEGLVQLTLAGSQRDFPVVARGQVVGVVTQAGLLEALARADGGMTAADVMRRDLCEADSGEPLETALVRLRESHCSTMPVVLGGRLVGLLTMDNIGELMRIRAAMTPRAVRSTEGA